MDAVKFISGRLSFKGNIAMICIAVSFLVMIIAVAVSSGFRKEIRGGLSEIAADVSLTPPSLNVLDEKSPIEANPEYLPYLQRLDCVDEITPVIYRSGIVKEGEIIHGVLFKAVPKGDTASLNVEIPVRLAQICGLDVGDRMLVYFIGEKLKLRRFTVSRIYEPLVQTDDRLIVIAGIEDFRRLNGWDENQVSALEISLDRSYKSEKGMYESSRIIGTVVNAWSENSESPVVASSSVDRYPQIFDWLNLIDFNVYFILLLMTIVAGFNMISGLLIILFENISTIGLLKALGMTNGRIAGVFLSMSASFVAKGMLAGNLIAFALCGIQYFTHVLKLSAENYFISFVPVHLDFAYIFLADALAFAVIMLLLLIPCIFISKVDPAQTIRQK